MMTDTLNPNQLELLEKIRLGEDSQFGIVFTQFGRGILEDPTQDDLADEVAALANVCGGTLLLGVDREKCCAFGILENKLDQVDQRIQRASEDSIKPPLALSFECLTLPDDQGVLRPVYKVEVPQSRFIHRSPGGYFHRVDSSKQIMEPRQLAKMIMQRSQVQIARFDETLMQQASMENLDETLWRRFVADGADDMPEKLLANHYMAGKDDNGAWRPTVAGLLLASRSPEEFMPSAFIQAIAYRGNVIDTGRYAVLDANDITGPLDQQVIDACNFVERNMRVAAHKGGGSGRLDIPDFDMQTVFEALANAVAHRDYSVYGSKIRLRLFANRMELFIPGMLANTMRLEHFPYRQASRNEAITSLLARCPIPAKSRHLGGHRDCIMDKRGEGVPLILSLSQELSGRLPEYRLLDESELMLTIYTPDTSGDGPVELTTISTPGTP